MDIPRQRPTPRLLTPGALNNQHIIEYQEHRYTIVLERYSDHLGWNPEVSQLERARIYTHNHMLPSGYLWFDGCAHCRCHELLHVGGYCLLSTMRLYTGAQLLIDARPSFDEEVADDEN
jgi:hypothetical protein